MSYIGKQPATVALATADIADGVITTAKIAADAITDAKIDKIYGEGSSELAMDDVLLNNKNDHNWTILNKDKETSYNQ